MEIYQAAVATASFALVVILSRRARLPAFLALLIGAFLFALVSRRGLGASGDAMSLGFAQTVETAGFAIIAGAVVTAALDATGAADRLAATIAPARRIPAVLLGLVASVVPSATVALALLRPWCRVLQGSSAASRAAATTTLALALSAGQAFIYPSAVAVATGAGSLLQSTVRTGRSAAWLARSVRDAEVPSSNLGAPTQSPISHRRAN